MNFFLYWIDNRIKGYVFLFIFLMMTTTLLWTSAFYILSHFFENFVTPSHFFVFERLSIADHEYHKSCIFIKIPIAFWFCIVNSSLSYFHSLTFFSLYALTIFMAHPTVLTKFNIKRWLIFFHFHCSHSYFLFAIHGWSQKIYIQTYKIWWGQSYDEDHSLMA